MLNPGEITIIISIVVVAGLILLYNKFSNKLPSVTGSGTVMSSNWKVWVSAAGAILTVGLLWWFWDTLSGSLYWRVAPLVLIAVICFRWAKSKDKGLLTNVGNISLIALAIVLLVSAPGRGAGNWLDAKAVAVTKNGVSALVDGGSNSCPNKVTLTKENTAPEKRPVIILRKGCATKFVAQVDWEPQFTTFDKRFKSALSEYGSFDWKNRYLMEITPADNFPTGDVEVHILNPEEAADMVSVIAANPKTIFNVSATAGTK